MEVAWVWYGFLYWINPSFTNHLKARWFHYKFCKGRAKVFLLQLYLGEWKLYIEKILQKRPGEVIPSHGLYAILKMIEEEKIQKIIVFLESEDVKLGIAAFIQELNVFNIADPSSLETLNGQFDRSTIKKQVEVPLQSPDGLGQEDMLGENTFLYNNAEQINARTYVIATQIYYERYRSLQEYFELKQSLPKYIDVVKQLFNVDSIPDNLSKYKNFDYRSVLKEKTEGRRGQLRRQLEQIIRNPHIFGEKVNINVEELLKAHFGKR